MSERCPLPARASMRDLLRDLVGAGVNVRPGTAQELHDERPAYLAGYRFDDDEVAALIVLDGSLSLAIAGALGAMSFEPAELQESLEQGLEGDLLEFLHEVVNISAKLLNSPTTPHVKLKELHRVPGEVPGDLAGVATQPRRREDWHVQVEGYGDGKLTLLG